MNRRDKIYNKITEVQQEAQWKNDAVANLNRARSVTVGTAFGGVSEIMLRRQNGKVVWATLQQGEVVELIYQLAALVGCDVDLHPREEFLSWKRRIFHENRESQKPVNQEGLETDE